MRSDPSTKPPILVSACLLGLSCRYDGRSKPDSRLVDAMGLAAAGRFLPACPEQLGGLPTPRPAVEIIDASGEDVLDGNARLRDSEGADRTDAFLRGASETLALARLAGCRRAILKERSPSCGPGFLVSLDGRLREGRGVTAALLAREGIEILGEESGELEAWLDEI